MKFKCPGSQAFSHPHPEFIMCRFCGTEIEMWLDEAKAKCPHCKKVMFREESQSCLEWCKYAETCVGKTVYKEFLMQKGGKYAKQKGAGKSKRTD